MLTLNATELDTPGDFGCAPMPINSVSQRWGVPVIAPHAVLLMVSLSIDSTLEAFDRCPDNRHGRFRSLLVFLVCFKCYIDSLVGS